MDHEDYSVEKLKALVPDKETFMKVYSMLTYQEREKVNEIYQSAMKRMQNETVSGKDC